MMESWGLTSGQLGSTEPSAISTPPAPRSRPAPSAGERCGSAPAVAVPRAAVPVQLGEPAERGALPEGGRGVVVALLQDDDAQPGAGEGARRDGAAGAGSDDDRVGGGAGRPLSVQSSGGSSGGGVAGAGGREDLGRGEQGRRQDQRGKV